MCRYRYVILFVLLLLGGGGIIAWRYFFNVKLAVVADPLYKGCLTGKVDSLAVVKKERCLIVYNKGRAMKKYHISLGGSPVGAKHFEGDGKTPEGIYRINVKNSTSAYHLSLGISYPSAADKKYAERSGHQPGGDIMIHGVPNGKEQLTPVFARTDWTAGCIALTNKDIDELYTCVSMGTPISIHP